VFGVEARREKEEEEKMERKDMNICTREEKLKNATC